MDEIADTFAAAGLDEGYARAAAATYRRLADFKDGDQPSVAAVVEALGYGRHR
jgi:hypothetical protein